MSQLLVKLLLRVLLLIVSVMIVGLAVLTPWSISLFSLLVWNYVFVRTLLTRLNNQERLSVLHAMEPDPAAPSSGTTQSMYHRLGARN